MSRSLMSTETTRQSRIEIITSFFSILAGEAPMKAREFICCDEGVMFETSVTVTNLHYQVSDRSKPSCNAPTEGRHSLFRN